MTRNPHPDVRELIHWGKTLCMPQRADIEWRVWQMALALERLALEPRRFESRNPVPETEQ